MDAGVYTWRERDAKGWGAWVVVWEGAGGMGWGGIDWEHKAMGCRWRWWVASRVGSLWTNRHKACMDSCSFDGGEELLLCCTDKRRWLQIRRRYVVQYKPYVRARMGALFGHEWVLCKQRCPSDGRAVFPRQLAVVRRLGRHS